ncbi:Fe-S cluster assembly protein HesB [Actinomadura roseirufa]|uniref:Fe-S cluster assembly protein HesB n=1 Tax=Actinomadura roseirufa TaxID=2094049 RepID=UPI001041A23B|nr:Fe-S cluster assembly protein HesB [Actinomadura roseirufa]
MLTLTRDAVQVIRTVTGNPELPKDTGLRIQAGVDGSNALRLSVAPQPEAGDQVVEEEGAKVYLEPPVDDLLEHKILDAQVDSTGDVAFTITDETTT